jgi:hypothetical protein
MVTKSYTFLYNINSNNASNYNKEINSIIKYYENHECRFLHSTTAIENKGALCSLFFECPDKEIDTPDIHNKKQQTIAKQKAEEDLIKKQQLYQEWKNASPEEKKRMQEERDKEELDKLTEEQRIELGLDSQSLESKLTSKTKEMLDVGNSRERSDSDASTVIGESPFESDLEDAPPLLGKIGKQTGRFGYAQMFGQKKSKSNGGTKKIKKGRKNKTKYRKQRKQRK